MAYNVFISYSAGADQVVALRLQTLASVYGFEAYVPPAQTRHSTATLLRQEVRRAIQTADLFFAGRDSGTIACRDRRSRVRT